METTLDNIEHVLTVAALLVAGASAWFVRKTGRSVRAQRKEDVVTQGIATARALPSPGVPLEVTALEYAILIDMSDGRSDFKREELWASIRARLASEKK